METPQVHAYALPAGIVFLATLFLVRTKLEKKPQTLNTHIHTQTNTSKLHKQEKRRRKSGVAKPTIRHSTVQACTVQARPQGIVQPPSSTSSTNLLPTLRMPPNFLLQLKQNRIDHAYVLAQTYKKLPSNHLC